MNPPPLTSQLSLMPLQAVRLAAIPAIPTNLAANRADLVLLAIFAK